ncbi:hypothetical protein H310_09642 [Aphanomyces invadans]|uniref:Uncharacterized protein n=1 Tax=Aphanomyces invadans TaxID=157072 RepID=A0A024TUJ2_9STRA|nr:hypothetical protein H310_09642 [Aphanomyces invadans]ETV97291.1 hypothetical protein H310_09642 [Aphanomyces invadans]|eukprot:XP_008873999.1 hypothetical protein H310_09642 [Aphanomyces invadans]
MSPERVEPDGTPDTRFASICIATPASSSNDRPHAADRSSTTRSSQSSPVRADVAPDDIPWNRLSPRSTGAPAGPVHAVGMPDMRYSVNQCFYLSAHPSWPGQTRPSRTSNVPGTSSNRPYATTSSTAASSPCRANGMPDMPRTAQPQAVRRAVCRRLRRVVDFAKRMALVA